MPRIIFFIFLFLLLPVSAQENPEITYEVAFVPSFLSANVYAEANGRNPIASLVNGTMLDLNGEIDGEWLGIQFEAQAAWIHQDYVIGNLDPILFCEDARVMPVIEALKEAVRNRDGEAFVNLIAPQGLYLGLQGRTQYLNRSEVWSFFDDYEPRFWGVSWGGEAIIYNLAGDVLPRLDSDLLADNLLVACQDNQDNLSDNSVLYAVNLSAYQELPNFYSLMRPGASGNELDWGAWGIAFSYWEDEPKIIALGHYRWTA